MNWILNEAIEKARKSLPAPATNAQAARREERYAAFARNYMHRSWDRAPMSPAEHTRGAIASQEKQRMRETQRGFAVRQNPEGFRRESDKLRRELARDKKRAVKKGGMSPVLAEAVELAKRGPILKGDWEKDRLHRDEHGRSTSSWPEEFYQVRHNRSGMRVGDFRTRHAAQQFASASRKPARFDTKDYEGLTVHTVSRTATPYHTGAPATPKPKPARSRRR